MKRLLRSILSLLLFPSLCWAGSFSPDAGCTLDDTPALVAYYNLDEASGTRADSVGSNDLTDNNTVTQETGIVGSSTQHTSPNNEYLSVADTADLSMADIDFTVAAWFYMDSKVGDDRNILSKTVSG